jgi:AraC-like DNA-binding protein
VASDKIPRQRPDAADAAHFDYIERSLVPQAGPFLIERHVPTRFLEPYHHHTSVEINYLDGVDMTYSFSGREVSVPRHRFALFWAAAPHRVIGVRGVGEITNIYLSLSQLLRWSLPSGMVEDLAAGSVLSAAVMHPEDGAWLDRLVSESGHRSPEWQRLHLAEIEGRLHRLALEGWERLLAPTDVARGAVAKGRAMRHVEAMLRHIADNFTRPLSVEEIAASAHVSPSHAMALFRDIMASSILTYLTRTRLSHACMLLTDTRAKIVTVALDSGFSSASRFYEAFRAELGVSPADYRRQQLDTRGPDSRGRATRSPAQRSSTSV